ncbi:MAG TPA: DUF2125 domain-containing protein [Patescibacteria group bacterium]|nr:DUF2125 domain-containing protein [Patescibacteria group bacterium]
MSSPIPRARLLQLTAAALLLLAVGGYSLWWVQLAHSLRDGAVRWIEARNASGWTITTGEIGIGGYPLAIRLTLPQPSVTDHGGNRWQGPAIIATIKPWAPNLPHLDASGHHVLTPAGTPPLVLSADSATADLVIDAGGIVDTVSIVIADASAEGAALGRLTATLRRLAPGKVDYTVASLGLSAEIDRLMLPETPRMVLGHSLTHAKLEARVMGSIPPGPLKPALAAWSGDGGIVQIDGLSLDWPPLGLSGKGTLALDRDMQPILASTCTLRGLFEAIDTLTRAGTVRAKDAGLAKIVLGLLSRPAADGVQELTVPLTVQNRTLFVGPAGLLKIPQMNWE